MTQGQEAIVDAANYEDLAQFKWFAHWNSRNRSFYAERNPTVRLNKQKTEKMHRRILGLSYGDKRQADHINHNTLDNRRVNLRVVTNRENCENRTDRSSYGPGVRKTTRPRPRPFDAHARIGERRVHLGCYATVEEAQEARRKFLAALEETT